MSRLAAGDLDLLVAAAREAGALALRYYDHNPETWHKQGGSVVSEADKAVDRRLAEVLRAARPAYGWRSEEEDEAVQPGRGLAFIVDPIDGTRDFLAGGREWTIALAVVEAGRPTAAVVFAPVLAELYAASAGGGAFLDRVPIRAAVGTRLADARIAGPRRYARSALDAAGVPADALRFVPSLAYRLTLVAAGAVDLAIAGPDAHDWDLAAADLLVHEAGAVLVDLGGRPPAYAAPGSRHPALVAAPAALAGEVRALISAHATGLHGETR
jgi:myo-inositol-1(or 4)-monophosphatase